MVGMSELAAIAANGFAIGIIGEKGTLTGYSVLAEGIIE